MKYFSFKELVSSTTAKTQGIDNIPTWEQIDNLKELIINLLDPLRQLWGSAIKVNSGFRSKQLNSAVGGVWNSHHTGGFAVDITTGTIRNNKKLFDTLLDSDLKWTQAILEKGGRWIHLSYVKENLKKQVSYT